MSPSPAFLPPTSLRPSLHPASLIFISRSKSPVLRPTALAVAAPVQPPSIITVDPFRPPSPRPRATSTRPVVIIPGYAADSASYLPMANALRASLGDNAYVSVAPVRYHSWLATVGGRPVTPIIELLSREVQKALRKTGADSVTIVAHSAAGWIARIYLGDASYPSPERGTVWSGSSFVHTLVCLGTPHNSAEPVTKRNMQFVNDNYPGSYHPDVRYVCFAGDGGSVSKGGAGHAWMFWQKEWFPRISYQLTDRETKGQAVAGDGIVPLSVAFLENADQNIRLKGVWHSPASNGPWYGEPRVVNYWSTFLK